MWPCSLIGRRQRRGHVVLHADALAPVLDERVQLGLRRLRRHAVLQPADQIQEVVAAILTVGRIQSERQPDLRAVVHEIGARRQDADDFARRPLISIVWPTIGSPAERALPELVRQHDDRRLRTGGGSRGRRRRNEIGLALGEQRPCAGDAQRGEQMLVDRVPTRRAAADRRRSG